MDTERAQRVASPTTRSLLEGLCTHAKTGIWMGSSMGRWILKMAIAMRANRISLADGVASCATSAKWPSGPTRGRAPKESRFLEHPESRVIFRKFRKSDMTSPKLCLRRFDSLLGILSLKSGTAKNPVKEMNHMIHVRSTSQQ